MHREFEQHFRNLFGKDYERFKEAIDRQPNVSLRLNPNKVKDVHFSNASQIPWAKNAYFLEERPPFYADPLHHAGAYYVQESSSMFFTNAIDFSRPMLALDLCASPGGKSTLILSKLNAESFLISNELDLKRNRVLVENLNRWGNTNVAVTNANANQFLAFEEVFDLIVVDAPCSGEGMFRKDKISLEQWSPNFVDSCAQIQKTITEEAVKCLKPGGVLIYSTCTFEPKENENQIRRIADEFDLEPVSIVFDPKWGVEEKDIESNSQFFKGYFFYLQKAKGEGQFVCALRKKGILEPLAAQSKKKSVFAPIDKKKEDLINSFLTIPTSYLLTEINGVVHAFPKAYTQILSSFKKKIPFWKLGVKVGEVSGKNFKPHHDLSMTSLVKDFENRFELDYQEAIAYLKREVLTTKDSWPLGWGLATYKGVPLGWGKNIGNRVNNYFPKELALRKETKSEIDLYIKAE